MVGFGSHDRMSPSSRGKTGSVSHTEAVDRVASWLHVGMKGRGETVECFACRGRATHGPPRSGNIPLIGKTDSHIYISRMRSTLQHPDSTQLLHPSCHSTYIRKMHEQIEQQQIERLDPEEGQVQLQQGHPPYAEHGAPVDHMDHGEYEHPAGAGLLWTQVRHHCREPFSEFFGTFILILFGDGGVAQVLLSNDQKGNYQSISWAWG